MSTNYEVKKIVCDYGLYKNGELKLILSNMTNALLIQDILVSDINNKCFLFEGLIQDEEPYYHNIGEPVLYFYEGEWQEGNIIQGHGTGQGIINVQIKDGVQVACDEVYHDMYIKPLEGVK